VFDLDDPGLLFRADVLEDPGPLYDQLRRQAPVWRIPGHDTFLVSDPALIREAVGRPDEFSSNLVSVLFQDQRGCPESFEMAPLGDPIHVLAVADPPVHAAQRRLLQPHLSPIAVKALERPIRTFADDRLRPLMSAGGGDIVADLTNPLPAEVVCTLLGFPAEDSDLLVPLVWDIGLLLDGVTDRDGMTKASMAALTLAEIVQGHLDAARAAPDGGAGLLSVLVRSIESGVITPDDAMGIVMQLVAAGTETTSSLMATAIEVLARDPALQAQLRQDPQRIPEFLEDVLRVDGPFQFHYRCARSDVDLGGTSIPAGSRVLLMWAAANRPDLEGTDGRPPHYAFGRGLHFCIGAPLARLEARCVLEELLSCTSDFTLDDTVEPVRRPSISLRRHVSLALRIVGNMERVPVGP
jgi:cytochrome P450